MTYVLVKCETCDGSGEWLGAIGKPCFACQGSGKVPEAPSQPTLQEELAGLVSRIRGGEPDPGAQRVADEIERIVSRFSPKPPA
jgi:hypothetical protein